MKRFISAKIIGGIIITIIVAGCAAVLVLSIWKNSPTDIFSISIAAVSAVLSVIALAYAMFTYYSIDKVQAANSMEGNALSDEKYSIAYTNIIKQYEDCDNEEKFANKLLDNIAFKKCKTCQDLAEQLQNLADNLIWFAYINDPEYIEGIKRICRKLERESKKKFRDINNGLKFLFEEYFKLIYSVIRYQDERKMENPLELVTINSIRGEMIRNPVTRIVYYNYLSLEYRYYAESILGLNGSMYSEDNIKRIPGILQNSDEKLFKCKTLLKHAEKAILKADKISDDNLLWSGYIKYNLARIHLFEYLLGIPGVDKKKVLDEIQDAYDTRCEILYIIWDYYYPGDSSEDTMHFLCRKMYEECKRGKELVDVSREFFE